MFGKILTTKAKKCPHFWEHSLHEKPAIHVLREGLLADSGKVPRR
jgi:hypothetical protein